MASADTTQEIIRVLRNTDKPAMSAADLADKIGVSVRTINNHTSELVDEEKINATQIGNATAYFLDSTDLPAHKKPDHTCTKCGREINEHNDFARVDYTRYFEGSREEPSVADFYILCRFCYSDLGGWIHNDLGRLGEYPRVHSWNIPDDQLDEVREDPDVPTTPPARYLDEKPKKLLELIESFEEESDDRERLWVSELIETAKESGMSEFEASNALETLRTAGHIQQNGTRVRTAK